MHTHSLAKVFFKSSSSISSVTLRSQIHTFNSVLYWLFQYSHRASLYCTVMVSLKTFSCSSRPKNWALLANYLYNVHAFCLLLDIFCLFLWVLIVSMLHGKDLLRAVIVGLMEEFYIFFFKIQRVIKLYTYFQVYDQ